MHALETVVCPVLVGCDDLLALAPRRLAEVAGGYGGLLFLAGEAGVGGRHPAAPATSGPRASEEER